MSLNVNDLFLGACGLSTMNDYEPIVSTKRNRMLYIDGVGLFYIAKGNQLCFVGAGQDKIKKITNKSDEICLEGLGYYNYELFYWYQNSNKDESELRAVNIHTFEKRKVKSYSGLNIEYRGVIVFRKDKYILLNDTEQSIWEVSVSDGRVNKNDLPVLRYQNLPQDWQEFFDEEETIKFDTFVVVSDYGYASVRTAHQCTIRFSLNNPSDYECMPISSYTANPDYGFIIQHNDIIYSCASECCYPNHFYVSKKVKGKLATKVLIAREQWLSKTDNDSMKYWWKDGNKYVFHSLVLNLEQSKIQIRNINDEWKHALNEIIDFVEDGKGNVYLMTRCGDVFSIPNGVNVYVGEVKNYTIVKAHEDGEKLCLVNQIKK